MLYGGSWTLQQYLDAETLNFGVAEVPQGKQKSVLCSGMAFTVASATKNPEAAVKLVEYLGSEEAQLIEAKAGAAIPAYNGTQTPWIENFTTVDASAFVDCIDYGHVSGGLTTNTSDAATIIDDYMLQIFSLERPVEETMKEMTEMVNASLQ